MSSNKVNKKPDYSYDWKLLTWYKFSTDNETDVTCQKCNKKHVHKSLVLENGENVCWYCWIRKGEEYGKVVSKKNNLQQSRLNKANSSISYESAVNNPSENIQRNNNKTANDKPLGSSSALFGANKKSNSVVKSIATPEKTPIQTNINTPNIPNEVNHQAGNIPAQQKAYAPMNEPATPAKRSVPPQFQRKANPVQQQAYIPPYQQQPTTPVQRPVPPVQQQAYVPPVQQQQTYTPPYQQQPSAPVQRPVPPVQQQPAYVPPSQQQTYTPSYQQQPTAPVQRPVPPVQQQAYVPPVQQQPPAQVQRPVPPVQQQGYAPPSQQQTVAPSPLDNFLKNELTNFDSNIQKSVPTPVFEAKPMPQKVMDDVAVNVTKKGKSSKFSFLSGFKKNNDKQKFESSLKTIQKQKADQEQGDLIEQKLAHEKKLSAEMELAHQQRIVEARRLANLQDISQEAKIAQIQKLAEEQKIADQLKIAQAQRLAEAQKLADQQRLIQAQKLAEEQKLSEAQKFEQQLKLAQAQRLAEAQKFADQQKLAQAQRQADADKIASQQKLSQIQKQAEFEKLTNQQKFEQQLKIAQAERLAQAKKFAEEQKIVNKTRIAQMDETTSFGLDPLTTMSSTTDLTTEVIKPIKMPKVKRIRTPKDSLFSTMKMNLTEMKIQRTIAKTEKMKSKELKVEAQPKIRKPFVQKPVNLGKLGKYNPYLGVFNDTRKVNIGWNIAKYSLVVLLLAISIVGIYFWTAWQATQTVIDGVSYGSGILVRLGIINLDQTTGSYSWSIFTDPNVYDVISPILDLKILTDLNQLISINSGVPAASISEISKTFSETMMISLLVYAIIGLLLCVSTLIFKNRTYWSAISMCAAFIILITVTIFFAIGITAVNAFQDPMRSIQAYINEYVSLSGTNPDSPRLDELSILINDGLSNFLSVFR